jgi:antitoxin VapB
MTVMAKLFMSGRSQAIRLPAKLRINAREVRIEQLGQALLVQPVQEPGQNMAAWLQGFYSSTEPLPEQFLADRGDAPAQSRDWA